MDDRFNRKDKPEGQEVIVSHDADGGLVLLHRIALDTSASEEARQALLDTTHASSTFRHPHVLAVREVRLEDGSLVFVQEHPAGSLLADRLELDSPIPQREALTWMRQFAQALDAAQSAGLTLSQICPTEFLIQEASPGGLLCLCPPVPAGWWLDVEDAAFASPEQKAGLACDIRSTMYSAGAVLANMLTQQRPAGETGWAKVLFKAKLLKAVNKALEAVLEVDPAKRCATPAEWTALLDQAIASIPSKEAQAKTAPAPETSRAALEPVKSESPPKRAIVPVAGNKPLAPSRVELGEAVFESPSAAYQGKRGLSPALIAAAAVVLVFGTWMLLPKKVPTSAAVSPPPAVAVESKPAETPVPSPAPAVIDAAEKPATETARHSSSAPAESKPIMAAAATPAIPPVPAAPPHVETLPPIPAVSPPAMPAAAPPAPEPVKAEPKPATEEARPEAATSKPLAVAAAPMPAAKPEVEAPPLPPVDPAKLRSTPVANPASAPMAETKPTPAPEPSPTPAPAIPEAKPQPAVVVTKPLPVNKDDLLQQAAKAKGPARIEAYRQVLVLDAHNAKALHGLVETILPDVPANGEKLEEFSVWAKELESKNDPLGAHALATLDLQAAATAKGQDAAIKIFVPAIAQLKDALHAGDDSAYPALIQASIDLHQAHILNHEKPKADRVSKALQDEIARTPATIPAQVPAELAASIEALLKERAAKGPPRMQEAFLKTVAQSLRARGNTPPKRSDPSPPKRGKPRR